MKRLGLLVAAVVFLVTSQTAHATINLYLQETGVNGGVATVVATNAGTATSFTGVYGDFTVSILGGVQANGALLSSLSMSATSVVNNTGASHTLVMFASADGYTLPGGSVLSVESGLGGSVNAGTLGLNGIFEAYADKGNNLLGLADFNNTLQNATPTGSTFDTGSANGVFSRLATPYSVTSQATFAMGANGSANFSSHVNLRPVPEPITMVAWAFGLVGFGGVGAARRWRRTAQA